jgi:hypothetical protein
MVTLPAYWRQFILMLVGFLLGAVAYRLVAGVWQWDFLAGALTAAAIFLVITLVRARRAKT